MRGPSPEPRQSPHGCPLPPEPAHFQWPSDGHRGTDTSQRRRSRSARAVSSVVTAAVHSRFTFGPCTAPATCGPGSDQSLEPSGRRRMRGPSWTEVDLPTCMTTVWVRTYDGTYAVPMPYLRRYLCRTSPRDRFAVVYFLTTNRQLRGYGPGAKRGASLYPS